MNKSAREKEALLGVFAAIVKPLTRVAFEYGISASEIAATVRRTYIQSLEARLLEQKRPTTDARLAMVAGLPKSDVTALREATRSGAPHSLQSTVRQEQVGILLTVWHTDARFSGAYGLPMELDVVPIPGSPRRSFRELIAVACPGADEEALLDELVAAASVEVIDSVTVRCLSRAYVPKGADLKQIQRMGVFLAAVATNFAHNLLRVSPEPVYFERRVSSDDLLSDVGRDQFLALASERGQELLTELDTFVTRVAASEASKSGKKYGVGVYFFEDSSPVEATEMLSEETGEETDAKTRSATRPIEEIDVLAGVRGKK